MSRPYQRASLGHTEAHIGFEPAEVRSRQRSHFIMRSISPTTLGTPNGQASTQFEQAMHRGFSADWTTPSSFCLMASAGNTSAQVGSVQCMQTVGAVWRDPSGPASTSSRWIIDRPRWVPHSSHACTQAPAGFAAPQDCRLTYNPDTNRLYVHVFAWPFVELFLDGLNADQIEYAQLLHDASEVKIERRPEWQGGSDLRPDTVTLRLPVKKPNVTVPVIELFLKKA